VIVKNIAAFLLETVSTQTMFEAEGKISDKAVAMFYPHLTALSKRFGIEAEKIIPMWEMISTEVERLYPDDAVMKKFIRSTIIMMSHTGGAKK
jgi:hypothetical protein